MKFGKSEYDRRERLSITAILIVLVLVLCFLSESPYFILQSTFSPIFLETLAMCRDSKSQWVLFLCFSIYFCLFSFQKLGYSGGYISNRSFWLTCAVAICVCSYGIDKREAAHSTQALTFLAEGTLVQCMAVWLQGQKVSAVNSTNFIVITLVNLLFGAALWPSNVSALSQYLRKFRWSGLWGNPNTFGMLVGVGVVLAAGGLLRSFKFKVSSLKLNESYARTTRLMKVIFFVATAGVMLFGLVKSYSRGAWLGAVIGIAFLIWKWMDGGEGEEKSFVAADVRRLSSIRNSKQRTWKNIRASLPRLLPVRALAVILASICVLAFWNFRHAKHSTTRRAFSVANVNDFSWRRRVAAYEGALQMIADKPWFGSGWNVPEPVYDKFYRRPKVDEGMAIQMNDYFMLGATLGIPALGCFIAYIYLSLGGGKHRTSNIEHPTSKWGAYAPRVSCSAPSRNTLSSLPATEIENPVSQPVCAAQTGTAEAAVLPMSEEEWLRMTCRAGAIVLLVGFFFDGGLFKLATGATFWILIELGSEPVQSLMSNIQSSGNTASAIGAASL
jgi:O-antigen ligase